VGWLWFFSLCWVTGFDIIYATLDEDFDRKHGLHSLPARLGKAYALQMSLCLHVVAFLSLYALWRDLFHTVFSFIWLLAVGVAFVWQHKVAARDPELAFFKINAVIGFLVLGLVWAGIA
jgi:4-hydroxybenzoate polyprenyltransferase